MNNLVKLGFGSVDIVNIISVYYARSVHLFRSRSESVPLQVGQSM